MREKGHIPVGEGKVFSTGEQIAIDTDGVVDEIGLAKKIDFAISAESLGAQLDATKALLADKQLEIDAARSSLRSQGATIDALTKELEKLAPQPAAVVNEPVGSSGDAPPPDSPFPGDQA